jgi:putative ABC transport system ATP-binding protein
MTSLVASDLVADRGGRRILDGVSLRIDPGERVVVTGHSGVGKTTLLHALAGVEPPLTGSVLLGEQPVDDSTRTRIALVPQHHGLVALLTAAENVELALQAAGRSRAGLREAAAAALVDVGLGSRTEHLVDELSGGEQQRVAVARALALGAEVILADEPTAELDAENRSRVLEALRQAALGGAAVLLTTHDDEVAARCDRVLLLHDGRLLADT